MRFETTIIQETSNFLLFTKYYQDNHTEQENGREKTHERGNGHAYAIFAENPELGKIKRK
jgi:hypothetical protein